MRTLVLALIVGASFVQAAKQTGPCGNLVCPGGFVATEFKGHACPYCIADKQTVQPYNEPMTAHQMILEKGAGAPKPPGYWADKAKEAFAWASSGAAGAR